jgi:hypothetical protein
MLWAHLQYFYGEYLTVYMSTLSTKFFCVAVQALVYWKV